MTPFVTVVSGAPRSGTSAMMQMLGAGGMDLLVDGVRRADRDNPRGYFELEAARGLASDDSWVWRAVGHAVKLVHALVPRLPYGPEYRIVLMRRDWREVLASQRAMLEHRSDAVGEHEYAPPGPPDERLAELFAAQLERLERWAASRPEVALLCVDYGALVRDSVRTAARVSQFLGGGLDVEDMAAAVLPSLWRQRAAG